MSIILEAKNISKTYHSGSVAVNALKPCNLAFEKGEFSYESARRSSENARRKPRQVGRGIQGRHFLCC